jgi:hypothetical protein
VQLRAAATGSDGLAEIGDDDLLDVIFPVIADEALNSAVQHHYERMLIGQERFSKFSRKAISHVANYPTPPRRKSHGALV